MIYNRGENPDDDYPWVLLVKTTGDQAAAKKRVEAVAGEVFPGRLFEGQYIEEMIADGFKDESRVLKIVLIFTLLSVLVSALGLFAMSSYYMQQEIRSVSVKKVFGADYSGVLKEHRRADCLVHYEPLAFRLWPSHRPPLVDLRPCRACGCLYRSDKRALPEHQDGKDKSGRGFEERIE